jgi:hypothetical protein
MVVAQLLKVWLISMGHRRKQVVLHVKNEPIWLLFLVVTYGQCNVAR